MLTLKRSVCIVRTTTTLEQVAASAAAWDPDLLILDMALDGLRIMHQVTTRAVAAALPFVMGLVGRGDLRSKAGCLRPPPQTTS